MRKLLLALILILTFAPLSYSKTYYVSVNGSDGNQGSINSTWGTWQKAFNAAVAGDTVFIMGGVYYSNAVQSITHSGTRDNPICIFGYPPDIDKGNWPILDCVAHCDKLDRRYGNVYNAGIYLDRVQFIHLKNLEVRNVYQCDAVLNGAITTNATANITYEQLRVHDVGQRGYWHTSGAWSKHDADYAVKYLGQSVAEATPPFSQPDTTRWINCDTWNTCDTLSSNPGNGGDAWKVVSYVGNYYYWEGCRAWNYSDDGFDPNKGERVFVDCWAMASNKYAKYDIEGNGFKSSAWRFDSDSKYRTLTDVSSKRLVKQRGCLALFCPGTGFYHGVESDSSDNSYWLNNTAYGCGIGFTSRKLGLDSIGDIYRNNISYKSTSVTATGVPYEVSLLTKYELSNNSWNWQQSYPNFVSRKIVSDDDFETVDSLELVALFTAPRQSNGALPLKRPLRLKSTSDLIDAGTEIPIKDGVNLRLPQYGNKPDIGYHEYTPRPLLEIIKSTYTTIDIASITYYSPQNMTISVVVLNSSGQQVLTMNHNAVTGENNKINVDLSKLSAGTYSIRLSDGASSDICSVIKTDPILFRIVKCFPNPTSDLFAIEYTYPIAKQISLKITNDAGQAVISESYSAKSGSNQILLNISTLRNGTYGVDLFDGVTKETTAIIKQ